MMVDFILFPCNPIRVVVQVFSFLLRSRRMHALHNILAKLWIWYLINADADVDGLVVIWSVRCTLLSTYAYQDTFGTVVCSASWALLWRPCKPRYDLLRRFVPGWWFSLRTSCWRWKIRECDYQKLLQEYSIVSSVFELTAAANASTNSQGSLQHEIDRSSHRYLSCCGLRSSRNKSDVEEIDIW